MRYRKFRGDYLFTGHSLAGSDQVLITNAAGVVQAIVPAAEAGDDVEVVHGLLTPGFVNAHCHLELSHMKGVVPEKTGMIDFLLTVMGQRSFPPEQVQQAIAEAETAMFNNGIVAVGDICNTPDTVLQKKTGRLYYHNFVEVTGFLAATAGQRFESAKATWQQFRDAGLPASIVPHAPYSVSPQLFALVAEWKENQLLTFHNQESGDEEAFFTKGTGEFHRLYATLGLDISFYRPSGRSSLQTCLPLLKRDQSVVVVHNVFTSQADLTFIRENSGSLPAVVYCLCLNANSYIGNGLPPVQLLRQQQVPLVIGTDSLASNHQLSVLEELKTIQHHFPAIPAPELLQWATYNGAAALQITQQYGSFEPGKKPGIVAIGEIKPQLNFADATAKRLL